MILEALYELPDHVGAGLEGYFERLADRGIDVVEAVPARLEVRR